MALYRGRAFSCPPSVGGVFLNLLHVALSSLLSVLALFLLARLMGRRQISQMDVFDYIIGITIGSIAAELAISPEAVGDKLLAMAVYAGSAVLLNVVTNKSRWASKIINGDPLTVFDRGLFQRKNLARAKMSIAELLALLRAQGYFDLSQVRTVVIEANGKLSILPMTANRPATPADMGLAPAQEPVFTEFIMDGHILEKNLQSAGFDEKWLAKQVQAQGFERPADVFLAQWDGQGTLACYGQG